MRWTLRRLLIGGMLFFTIVPLIVVVAWFDRSARISTHELAGSVLSNVADRVLAEAEQQLEQANGVMEGVASTSVFSSRGEAGRELMQSPEKFERLAFSLTRQVDDLPYLYFGGNDGRFHGVERVTDGMRIGLKAGSVTGPRQYYLATSPMARDKRLDDEKRAYDPRTRPWYQKAAGERARVFTEVYPSASKKALLVTLAQPVYDEQQVLLGVFALDLSLSKLAEQLQRQRISARGVAFVIDSSGQLVAASTGESMFREDEKGLQRVGPSASASPLLRAAAAHVLRRSETRDAAVLGTDQKVTRVKSSNESAPDFLLVQREFANTLGTKWSLVIAAPEVDFIGDANERRQLALWGVLAVGVVCALVALAFATRLSRRLNELSLSALALGRGEVPPAPQPSRVAEVGQLGQVLHDSAEQLRRYKIQVQEDEWALREAHNTLERRVQERTAELAASREEALEAARAKAAFLATMSHEIRTPLNGVVGMSSLLAETQLDIEQRDYLSTIRLSSEQLLGVINDILDFSKIESGKLELEQEPLLLRYVVEEACDIAAPRAREKGIELLVDVPIEPSFPLAVRGDPTRIRQVLINFINNAVKFTEKGEVAVQLRLLPHADFPRQTKLEFRVRDTGIGIPADRIGALFSAFTQVDASTTRKYGGTGLGLAICRRLAAAMGGEVGVQSTLGVGSEFWFTVSVAVCDDSVVAGLRSLPQDASLLNGQTVFVVDDNPTNLRILSRQLHNWGINVRSFDTVSLAMGALRSGPLPVAVVTDMHMPVVDGIEFARAAKAQPSLVDLPFVLLSSGVLPVQDPAAVLFSARLLKPAREAQLFEALARCVDPARAQALPAPAPLERKGKTVLVADDNAVNLKVAVSMLTKLGYDSATASDGRIALDLTLAAHSRRQAFAMILMDLNMPNMDGIDAAKELLRSLGRATPPIVALTAAASPEDRERCFAAGMNDYLTKPLQLNSLARALDRWIESENSSRFDHSLPSSLFEERHKVRLQRERIWADETSESRALPLMDFSRLNEFREFDDAELTLTRGVADVFLTDTPLRVEAVVHDLRAGDWSALAKSTHAVKGAASNVGAERLRHLMAAWEQAAREGRAPADAAPGGAELRDVWEKTQQALSAWLSS